MLARARRQPAWKVVAAYCAGAVLVVAVAEVSGSRVAGGVISIVLLAAFAAAIYRRPDGEGWSIFAVLIAVGAPLNFLDWPAGIELAAFVSGAMLVGLLLFDRQPASGPAPTQ